MARTTTTKGKAAAPRGHTAGKALRDKKATTPKPVAAAARRAPATPAPKLSKDELRAQVEKLERSLGTLRAKNRELTRAARDAAKTPDAPATPAAKRSTKPASAPTAATTSPRKPRQSTRETAPPEASPDTDSLPEN